MTHFAHGFHSELASMTKQAGFLSTAAKTGVGGVMGGTVGTGIGTMLGAVLALTALGALLGQGGGGGMVVDPDANPEVHV